MAMRIATLEECDRIIELGKSPYRPRQIVELKEEIEARTRLAEFREANGVLFDKTAEVSAIVEMKLRLDSLYTDWVNGKIS